MPDAASHSHLIVFDGYCIFCSGFARFMAKHDTADRFRFVTAQSDIGRALYQQHGLDPDELSTNIVIVDGNAFTKMQAFAAAMKVIGWPWAMLSVVDILPHNFANWIYDRIARNRYIFGKRDCMLPSSAFRARLIE